LMGKAKEKITGFLNAFRRRQQAAGHNYYLTLGMFLFLTSALVFCSLYISHLHQVNTDLEQRKARLKTEIDTLHDAKDYEIRKMNITKYAPLDPMAVRGWDFSGNRTITASGETVEPGETAAAGPEVPFGTRIYVEGKGWYTVKDRGGAIGADEIDLAVDSKDVSQEFGIQERLVIMERP